MNNSTGEYLLKCDHFFPPGGIARYSFDIVLLSTAFISTLQNLYVIKTICAQHLQNSSDLLTAIFSTINLLVGLVLGPISFIITEFNNYWSLSYFTKFWWLYIAAFYITISTVITISVNQWLQVRNTERYMLTTAKLIAVLVTNWSLPFLITILLANLISEYAVSWFILIFFALGVFTMYAYLRMILILNGRKNKNVNKKRYLLLLKEQREATLTTMYVTISCLLMNYPPVLHIMIGLVKGRGVGHMCTPSFLSMLVNTFTVPTIYSISMKKGTTSFGQMKSPIGRRENGNGRLNSKRGLLESIEESEL